LSRKSEVLSFHNPNLQNTHAFHGSRDQKSVRNSQPAIQDGNARRPILGILNSSKFGKQHGKQEFDDDLRLPRSLVQKNKIDNEMKRK
jgi:hypothetical protein